MPLDILIIQHSKKAEKGRMQSFSLILLPPSTPFFSLHALHLAPHVLLHPIKIAL